MQTDELRDVLSEHFGNDQVRQWEDSGTLVLVNNQASVVDCSSLSWQTDKTQAFCDKDNGQIVLVAEGLQGHEVPAVFIQQFGVKYAETAARSADLTGLSSLLKWAPSFLLEFAMLNDPYALTLSSKLEEIEIFKDVSVYNLAAFNGVSQTAFELPGTIFAANWAALVQIQTMADCRQLGVQFNEPEDFLNLAVGSARAVTCDMNLRAKLCDIEDEQSLEQLQQLLNTRLGQSKAVAVCQAAEMRNEGRNYVQPSEARDISRGRGGR